MGLGMYEYYVGQAPLFARPFAFALVGVWGNERLGLEHLQRAAAGQGPARMEARAALAAIYASEREKRWEEAEALLKELVERYPGNPLYRLRRVYVALRRGAWGEARALADPEGAWLGQVPSALRERARAAALYRAAGRARRAPAGDVLLSRLENSSVPGDMAEWVARRRGERSCKPPPISSPLSWPVTGTPD